MSKKKNATDEDIAKRDKAIEAISKDPYRIIKGNPIINARLEITAIQMKVFLQAIASIDQSKDKIPMVKISVLEFQKFAGIRSKNIYSHIEKEIAKLTEKRINYEDEKVIINSSLISGFVYHKKEGYFTFEIPQLLYPFILQLRENFTVIDIRNFLRLDSVYAMRFYEFCKQHERFGRFEFMVDELKILFKIENKYKNYFDFKQKVVSQARSELKENSELYFDFEEVKEGKKVTKLIFTIIKNYKPLQREEPSTENAEQTEINQALVSIEAHIVEKEESEVSINTDKEDISLLTLNEQINLIAEIYNAVKPYKIAKSTVKKWVETLPSGQIKLGINHVFQQLKAGKTIKNVGGYIAKMVNTTSLVELVQEEQLERERKSTEKKVILDKQEEEQQRKRKTDELLHNFTQAKKAFIIRTITENDSICSQIITKLKESQLVDKPQVIEILAFENYIKQVNDDFSPKAFLYALEKAGFSFYAYVVDWFTQSYPLEMNQINERYAPQAAALGVTLW